MHKLLTIDDEEEFTRFISDYFELRDFEVFKAQSGEVGLSIAMKEQPCIALVDMKMPGMKGDAVLQEMIKISPKTKVIMVTASEGYGKTRERLKQLGAFWCFDKPIASMKELEEIVNRALVA